MIYPEEMLDAVRGVMQLLRGKPGVTFTEVRRHCIARGDDMRRWPDWALAEEGYVTEAAASMLIYEIMDRFVPPEVALTWRPISTAPKDGTEILAWREDAGTMLIRWAAPVDFLSERELDTVSEDDAHVEDWFYADFVVGGRVVDGEPTHWQPIPDKRGPQRETPK